MSHSLRYYDHSKGRFRYKRRYIWAAGAFGIGALLGVALALLL